MIIKACSIVLRSGKAAFVIAALAFAGNAELAFAAQTEDAPGTLRGAFHVDGSGSANYMITLELPPGTNQVQPDLSLSYNSRQHNGLLGVGWSLSGLSTITRCGKTIAQDGVRNAISFSPNTDRFCVNGERLIAYKDKSNTLLSTKARRDSAYGQDGTQYRAERENWTRYISHGTSCGQGPCRFSATTKDGSSIDFGNTADSRIEAQGRADGTVRLWAVNRTSDRNGNYVMVAYVEDPDRQASYPSEIRYTGNEAGNLQPQRLVQFAYQDRSDIVPAFVAGSQVQVRKLLTDIRLFVDLDGNAGDVAASSNLVRDYRISYELSAATRRSRIKQIQECGLAGTCLPATGFEYQEEQTRLLPPSDLWIEQFGAGQGWSTAKNPREMADVNGDGLSDVVGFGNDGVYVALSNGAGFTPRPGPEVVRFSSAQGWNTEKNPPILADVNGDGLADLVGFGDDGVHVAVSTGTQYSSPGLWIDEFGVSQGWSTAQNPRTMADVNGDGLSDVIGFGNDGVHVALSNGTGFVSRPGPEAVRFSSAQGWNTEKNPPIPADVNGDGLADLVGFGDDGVYVALSNGTAYSPPGLWIEQFGDNQGWSITKNPRTMADVNGDGLSDVVGFGDDGVHVAYSNGAGFVSRPGPEIVRFSFAQGWDTEKNTPLLADVDGDGLADLIGFGNDGVLVASSTGSGFQAPDLRVAEFGSDSGWSVEKNPRLLADVNGDGLTDVIGFRDDGVLVASSTGPYPDLLSTVTDGLGSRTTIAYEPLTDGSLYTKGGGARYPEVEIQGPLYVVSRTTVTAGRGADHSFTHTYAGGKTRLDGRGWLGFSKTTVTDVQSKTQNIQTYHQDFPRTGLLQGREIRDLSNAGALLGKTSITYDQREQDGTYVTRKTSVISEHYTEGTRNFATRITFEYDADFKNMVKTTEDFDHQGAHEDIVHTCIQYANPDGNAPWWHGFFPVAKKIVNQGSVCDGSNFAAWDPKGSDTDTAYDWRFERFRYDGHMDLNSHEIWDDTNNKWIRTTMDHDAYGNVTSVTDPLGNTSIIEFEGTYRSFPQKHTSPVAAGGEALVTTTTYEPKFGIRIQTTDANGNFTQSIPAAGIDGFGRVTEMQSIRPESATPATVSKKSFSQGADGIGMIVKTWRRPDWDEGDDWDPEHADKWYWSTRYFDGVGRLYKSESKGPATGANAGQAVLTDIVRNSQGRISKRSLPHYGSEAAHYVEYKYNVNGLPIETIYPNGAVEQTEYNLHDDRRITHRDNDPRQISGMELIDSQQKLDTRSRTRQFIAPDGSITEYEYDRLGRRIAIHGPLGEKTTFTYNSLGQVAAADKPDLGRSVFAYWDNGRLHTSTDAKGQTISRDYDALGRTIAKTTPQKKETYHYDQGANGKGRLVQISTSTGDYQYDWAYDQTGAIKSHSVQIDIDGDGTRESFSFAATTDPLGRPGLLTYPDGSEVDHTYTDEGFLHRVRMKDPGDAAFSDYATFGGAQGDNYTARGKFKEVLYDQNGVASVYAYDIMGRLQSGKTGKGALTLRDFSYVWNNANKLLEVRDNRTHPDLRLSQAFKGDTTTWYDDRGRLTRATGPYEDQSYGYDAASNIVRHTAGPKDTGYAYDRSKKHQLVQGCDYLSNGDQCSGTSASQRHLDMAYDANGNTLSKTILAAAPFTWHYVYDPENRLVRVEKEQDGVRKTVNSFVYNASGQRIQKLKYDGAGQVVARTSYISPAFEIDHFPKDNKANQTRYLVGPQGAIAAFTGSGAGGNAGNIGPGYPVENQIRYFHHDHLGSSILVTDRTGAETNRMVYEPYARIDPANSTGDDTFRPKFTGKEWDTDSALYYFGLRYYDAQLGRFLTPDPAGQFHSPYLYGAGDPLTLVDPDGASFGSILSGAFNVWKKVLPGGFLTDKALGFLAPHMQHSLTTGHFGSAKGFFSGFAKGAVNIAAEMANFAVKVNLPTALPLALLGTQAPQIPTLAVGSDEEFGAGAAEVASYAIPGGGEEEAAARVSEEAGARGAEAGAARAGEQAGAKGVEESGAGKVEEERSCSLPMQSFIAGTAVSTSEGSMAIEKIEVGDEVWAFDEATGEAGLYPVSRLFQREAPGLVILTVSDQQITTTPEHPFGVDGRGWIPAEDLKPGDNLLDKAGRKLPLEKMEMRDSAHAVFNFQVEKAHTYYVSEKEILVHNQPCRRSQGPPSVRHLRPRAGPDSIELGGVRHPAFNFDRSTIQTTQRMRFSGNSLTDISRVNARFGERAEFRDALGNLKTPDGFVWHHDHLNFNPNTLEGDIHLIPSQPHNSTYHYGGSALANHYMYGDQRGFIANLH